jgi:hypothetical protein
MPDFFISYTSKDEAWAEWIGWTLEANGYEVVLQKWDFVVGSNFVLEMQRAASTANRTILVLSPDYLSGSSFGAAEWASAFVQDPEGAQRKLIPLRVKPCEPKGLLKAIVRADLFDLDQAGAEKRLMEITKGDRLKPTVPPPFPGGHSPAGAAPHFPGATTEQPGVTSTSRYMPKLRRSITDLDRRRFARETFSAMLAVFKERLATLKQTHPGLDFEIVPVDANTFTAEIFLDGQSRARCKVWIGGMAGSDAIAFAEGSASQSVNTLNEELHSREMEGELVFHALMAQVFGRIADGLNLQNLSAEEAIEYLWRRFSSELER